MPYNYKDFEVVQVAFPRESSVLAHLREEAVRYKGRVVVGPHILELLTDRDSHLYGTAEGQGKGIWFPSSYQVVSAPTPDKPDEKTVIRVEQAVIVEEFNSEDIDVQAALLAAAFSDDDDD